MKIKLELILSGKPKDLRTTILNMIAEASLHNVKVRRADMDSKAFKKIYGN